MDTFQNHIRSMENALNALIIKDISPIINLFCSHKRIIFCTMGKSAFACAKIVYTARSYGLECYDLDVCHAFHGDAGIIKENDLLVMVSKSGETKEVIEVTKYFNNYTRIAVVSNENSTVAKLCDHLLLIPTEHEGSPFGYAPMVSTSLYMIVLHALLCETIVQGGITVEEYARNHPSGDIGKQLDSKLSPKNSF